MSRIELFGFILISASPFLFIIYNDILLFTTGGPDDSTMTPALYMFLSAFKGNRLGYGTAIGIVVFFISLILSYINFKLLRQRSHK